MPIKWRLAVMMAEKNTDNTELAKRTGLHFVTISKLKGSRLMPKRLDRDTLEKLCRALNCQPADLLQYIPDAISTTDSTVELSS